jgi:hypothetical protein
MFGHFEFNQNLHDLVRHSIDVVSCTLCFFLGVFVTMNIKE